MMQCKRKRIAQLRHLPAKAPPEAAEKVPETMHKFDAKKGDTYRHRENAAIAQPNRRTFLLHIPRARSSFHASFTECGLAARRIYCIWQLLARQRLCPRNSQNSDAIQP